MQQPAVLVATLMEKGGRREASVLATAGRGNSAQVVIESVMLR